MSKIHHPNVVRLYGRSKRTLFFFFFVLLWRDEYLPSLGVEGPPLCTYQFVIVVVVAYFSVANDRCRL